ncbi:MAG: GTP-binding protein [Lachnospiraceae bacterium]|nr:GTP-binding protein [Lachnospiraceae bacterium]
MKILIVSGFLGAGKTTFIRELIRRTGTYPVVMENEYGESDLDSRELNTQQKELKILEFMEGCVCCTMKDSFINSVLTVSSALAPEYLIVEPTGVARLSGILENAAKICYGDIRLLKPVTILSPRSFYQNRSEWPELFDNQLKYAGIVVFSKTEGEDRDYILRLEEEVRKLNPGALILTEHYRSKEDEWFKELLEMESGDISVDGEEGSLKLEQLTLFSGRFSRPAELIVFLEDILREEYGKIVRAKGTLPVGSGMLRFDIADSLYAVTGTEDDKTQCVFIGEYIDREAIGERLGAKVPGGLKGKASGKALRTSERFGNVLGNRSVAGDNDTVLV